MKKFSQFISILIIGIAVFSSFYALLPTKVSGADTATTSFSTTRAFEHVKQISKYPHYVGSNAHQTVLEYIQSELHLLGLETQLQSGYTAGDWANLSKATNILARIKGTAHGKALLLLSHYDSNPHSSKGASDDASGVATILESVRVFLAAGKVPSNDIIILFSDAEELGLNGAQLFVQDHPWLKDVGLVLNFEARGSGGPSYMLIETNGGNSEMVSAFKKAGPEYPVANSFMYSIYKMLPNDTDLTVFREEADINGFNFAFIDDHFDYHTQLDSYDRLDPKTLEHQGSYLMPLLTYFSDTDLSGLKSERDSVYFNVPVFKLVSYPFSLIIPSVILAILGFLGVLIYGKRKKVIRLRHAAKGFLPFILILIVNGVIGYFAWAVLTFFYPAYKDILHGFTYNGHWYIAAWVSFSLAVCFLFYGLFMRTKTRDLTVAPLAVWLLITVLLSLYLKGGAFFVIPFYFALIMWFLLLKNRNNSMPVLSIIAIPVIVILVPFVQMFPVGLGLKMMVASTIFVSLIFGLLLPLFGRYRSKKFFVMGAVLTGIIFMAVAHLQSGFTKDRPKPSSLVYYMDADTHKGYWATYDSYISPWTADFIKSQIPASRVFSANLSSKYDTGFKWVHPLTSPFDIAAPEVQLFSDSISNGKRYMNVAVVPQRPINRVEIFTKFLKFDSVKVNGVFLDKEFLDSRTSTTKLITHYVSDNDPTILDIVMPANESLELEVIEAANDLLTGRLSVPERPENEIPMPFVLNDATIIKKTYKF